MGIFCMSIDSDATDRWIEEDSTGEVCIAPLREGCLLLEVSLDRREVLLLEHVVDLLISRSEVFVLLIVYRVIGAPCAALHGVTHCNGGLASPCRVGSDRLIPARRVG